VGVLRLGLLAGVLTLAARAGQLTMISTEAANHGERQIHTWITLPGARGLILDRDHKELAISIDAPSVYVFPQLLAEQKESVARLARVLDLDRQALEQRVSEHEGFTYIARWVSAEQARDVESLQLAGVGIEHEPRRTYPAGRLGAPLLGFVDIDGKGRRGIEQMVDAWLTGQPHAVAVERDARGRLLCSTPQNPRVSAGGDVVLSIDAGLQAQAVAALTAAVSEHDAKGGFVIAIDPQNGDLLTMAEAPGFDPNNFRHTHYKETRSRVFLDVVEPGSTLKPFVVAAAIDAGLIDHRTQFDTGEGWLRVPGKTIRDHHPYGVIDAATVLRFSSNIGAVQISQLLGPERHHEALVRLGFGATTRSGFPSESNGLLRDWRKWKPVDHATIAFGQGISVTPIQLAMALAALANEGELMQPRLVLARRRPLGTWKHSRPISLGRAVNETTARRVLSMMESVVSGQGTGRRAALAGVRVAGKTGTAQKFDSDEGRYSNTRFVAWFMGVAPADDPKVAIVVALDEPSGRSHTGGSVAAPLFASVAAAQLAHHGITTEPEPIPAEPIPTLLVNHAEDKKKVHDEQPAYAAGSAASQPPAENARKAVASRRPNTVTLQLAAAAKLHAGGTRTDASSHLRSVLVPNFHGESIASAKRKAAAEALDLRVLGGNGGRVVDQSPAAGTIVAGSQRTIQLSFSPAREEG
jgi:cell division protein FtsI (penicillin-binding protein 3)